MDGGHGSKPLKGNQTIWHALESAARAEQLNQLKTKKLDKNYAVDKCKLPFP